MSIFNNLESIGIEGKSDKLIKYTYRDNNGRLKKIAYANGDYARLGYDRYGNMISEKWFDENGLLTYEYVYSYDNEGNIVKTIDKASLKEYNYTYDEGNLIRAVEYDVTIENDVVTSKSIVVGIVYLYNKEGELVKKKAIYPDGTITGNAPSKYEVEEKEIDGSEFTVTPGMEDEDTPYDYVVTTTDTDELGRKLSDSVGKTASDIVRSFTYVEGLDPTELGGYNEYVLSQNEVDLAKQKYKPTTQLVKDITVTDKKGDQIHTFYYEYDGEERIKKLVETYTVNGEIVTDTTLYSYDDLGQLLTETKNGTVINSMTYDGYGNILTKNGNTYGYINSEWDDLLTHYNGQQITYDAQGNPTTYRGKSLVWEKGRQLKSYGTNSYTYNANGIRTSKTVGGVKHTYILDGTKILKETWGTNTIIPLYDNEDNVCGICYNGDTYYFVKNLQGDVVSLITKVKKEEDEEAKYTVVARYSYDAWGKCTIVFDSTDVSIATINPYRYRGYYYDAETGLYYLQSRYYDAEVGRFINGDEAKLGIVNGVTYNRNLYAYCDNDPVNQIDSSGFISMLVRLLIIVGAGIVVALVDMNDVRKRKEFRKATDGGKFMQLATAFLNGFFKGAGAAFFTMLGGIVGKAVFSGLLSCVFLLIDNIKNLLHGKKMSSTNFTKAFSDGYTGKVLNQYLFGEIIDDFCKFNFKKSHKLVAMVIKTVTKVFKS